MSVAPEVEDVVREPPNNIAAEQCVLSGMLIGADRHIDEVAEIVQERDFFRPAHRIVFATMLALHREARPVDSVTVLDALTTSGELMRVGGGPYLQALMAAVPNPENATYYARIVKGLARKRALIEVGSQVMRFGYQGDPNDIDDLVGQAVRKLVDEDAGEGTAPTLDTLVFETLDWLETGEDDGRVPVPYRDLNTLLGGLKPGQMVVIGARPAVGKSLVAIDIARHAALRCGLPVYFATLEMSQREVTLRVLAAEGRIDLKRLTDRKLTDAEWTTVSKLLPALTDSPRLVIDDKPGTTVDRLRAELRRMARRDTGPARLVVVDYVQLMEAPPGRRRQENRQLEVSENSRALKLLAKEFGVPVVVLSQLNRGVEARSDKRPVISDLRESGSLEQDADVVMLLHRDEQERPGEMEIIVGKSRNGPTGSVAVAFQGHFARAVDMARP